MRASPRARAIGRALLIGLVGVSLTSCQQQPVPLFQPPQLTIDPANVSPAPLEFDAQVQLKQVAVRRAAPANENLPAAWRPDEPPRAWKQIVIHHSASAAGSVASIDAEHRRRVDADGQPWLGIGYHFVIGNGNGMSDAEIEPTFRWLEQLPGAHAGVADANATGIGICLIGNFDDAPPTPRQLDAAVRLTRALAAEYDIAPTDIRRHGDLKATACPGREFPWDDFHAALADSAAPLE
ncbi:MAG: N-acetylmuramoyl-L-alanine amidase [Pirellulales bacterium]